MHCAACRRCMQAFTVDYVILANMSGKPAHSQTRQRLKIFDELDETRLPFAGESSARGKVHRLLTAVCEASKASCKGHAHIETHWDLGKPATFHRSTKKMLTVLIHMAALWLLRKLFFGLRCVWIKIESAK